MEVNRTIEKEIGSYISTRLREYFGKGPSSVYVAIKLPYIAIQLRGFLAPTEKILLRQKESRRVLKTRELLMKDLKTEISAELMRIGGFSTSEMYVDWNLEEKTGMLLVVLDNAAENTNRNWPEEVDEATFRFALEQIGNKTCKLPEDTEIFWLNHRIILLKHSGIFLNVEKELIKAGFSEELKLAKRSVERTMHQQLIWKPVISRNVQDVFIDWNLEEDKGYIVLLLENEER